MKTKLMTLICFLTAFSPAAVLADSGGTAAVETYVSTCRYEHPLDTYESCEAWTNAGQRASECARQEADFECRQGFNSDCVLVGTSYKVILSEDFIGYKACEATATVHGYRLEN
jgi:hypothetical protein